MLWPLSKSGPRSHSARKIGLEAQSLFEPDPEKPGGLIRIDPDGTKTRGLLKGRAFIPDNS